MLTAPTAAACIFRQRIHVACSYNSSAACISGLPFPLACQSLRRGLNTDYPAVDPHQSSWLIMPLSCGPWPCAARYAWLQRISSPYCPVQLVAQHITLQKLLLVHVVC